MRQEAICIYCGKTKNFCKAHILPESLGKFKGQPKQKRLVCSECDNEIGKAEEQIAKCSAEAIFKIHLNIKGKKKHKSTSPFRRRHAGQGPIDLKMNFPGEDYEVLVEPRGDGEYFQPLPQLILTDSEKNQYCVRLSEPMKTTVEFLKSEIKKSGLPGRLNIVTAGLTNEEIEYVFGLLKNSCKNFNEEPIPDHEKKPVTKYYKNISAKGEIRVDAKYFRAIAKIGFHYFLQYSKFLSGHEKCFLPVKQFIRYGEGKVDDYVTQHKGNLVSDINRGLRPKYYGHFLIGDFQDNRASAFIQLFIGKDVQPAYYKVNIATDCFHIRLDNDTFGHFYSYYTPEEREKYSGEIQQLGVADKIQLPWNF